MCHMAIDVAKIGRYRSGAPYFEALRDAFMNKYGLQGVPRAQYANYLDFGVLEEAFSLSYEEYAKKLLARQNKSLIDLTWQRNQEVRRVRGIKQSGSYLLGKRIGDSVKSLIPSKATDAFIVSSFESLEAERFEKAEKDKKSSSAE